MQKTYYIGFSELGNNSIFDTTIIEGRNGVDALFKHYGKKFKRSADRYVEVVMTECTVKDGKPLLCGNQCGYKMV